MSQLALQGRSQADEQRAQADGMSRELSSAVAESSSLIERLNEVLVKPSPRAPLAAELDYDEVGETAQKLAAEARRLRADVQKQVAEADAAVARLTGFKFREDSFDSVMKTANDKLNEFAGYVSEAHFFGQGRVCSKNETLTKINSCAEFNGIF